MARYTDSVCRLCRREGTKLFLKGSRCLTEKCAIDRRAYAPGQHGQARPRISEYRMQLREKQKLKRIYGLMEKQFRTYFQKAERKTGITGETLLQFLERRLDNVVYRMGFASSRSQARQLVGHKHILVNGKNVDIPSFLIKQGDVVEVKEKSRTLPAIVSAIEVIEAVGMSSWIELDKANFKGTVKNLPLKEDISLPVNEQLVVELYSR
ncbi:MAG: 30S ribosomal protein S4 [Nitrospirae bacterium]|nr:30S ribosomal protein S4 [Nitrospirota bacterium]MBI3351739.1 30S ribosomal protein S4 [Nitrospirota bacterium]